ncbi:uncharacterized protein G2W53_007967 [Senna tora]|uniref:Uncharacterized protein n=1 Tax=Senna tora TaxID=362788 RepID=A0A834X7L9_9FABA|nr:uncharacterized protein G2W53_007967 [Senna tora]
MDFADGWVAGGQRPAVEAIAEVFVFVFSP